MGVPYMGVGWPAMNVDLGNLGPGFFSIGKTWTYTLEDERLEHVPMEVWFRSFSFLNGWLVGSMLIFQCLGKPTTLERSGSAKWKETCFYIIYMFINLNKFEYTIYMYIYIISKYM